MNDNFIEVQIDATGIDKLIEDKATKFGLTVDRDQKNLDGALICSIIGTGMAIATFCLELYKTVSDKKKVKYISKDYVQEGMTLDKASSQARMDDSKKDK